MKRTSLIAYGLAVLTIVFDQLSKLWVLNVFDLPSKGSVHVGGPVSLTMVWNEGVSFGLLRAEQDLTRWALVVFSLAQAGLLGGKAVIISRQGEGFKLKLPGL